MVTTDTSGKALVAFWKYAGDKGLMNANSARFLKTTSNQVLGVLDGWEELDVKVLNLEDVFRRFVNKRGQKFTPASLMTYKRRFFQAVNDFITYTKNPETWKPSSAERPIVSRRERNGSKADKAETPAPAAAPAPESDDTLSHALTEYLLKLKGESRFARLKLPSDLTSGDVKKLVSFLQLLVEEE